MSYTALYRKYRPTGFDMVYGQEHIVRALKNQLKNNRIAHAYLFCGTRGTGKTTMAKIFAGSVNCDNLDENGPCGQCDSCKSFAQNRSMNIIELDAASNNGVDEIRNIIDELNYPPSIGRYKVYIIDEVHMLSTSAFNALLKTLEEPPEYAIFILATTEPNKLPATILSRCQRYDFRPISSEIIAKRLLQVVENEGIKISRPALDYIARAGDGSMRDALSILDRCSAFGIDEEISLEIVSELLGTAEHKIFADLLLSIVGNNAQRILEIVSWFSIEGLDYYRITADFLWYLRNIIVLKVDENLVDILNISKENADEMIDVARKIDMPSLVRYSERISSLYNSLRYSNIRRIELEIALMSLCSLDRLNVNTNEDNLSIQNDIKPNKEVQAQNTSEPLRNVSEVLDKPQINPDKGIKESSNTSFTQAEKVPDLPDKGAIDAKDKKGDDSPADLSSREDNLITEFRAGLNPMTKVMIKGSKIEIVKDTLVIYSEKAIAKEHLEQENIQNELSDILENITGLRYNIKSLYDSEKLERVTTPEDREKVIQQFIKYDIKTEEY